MQKGFGLIGILIVVGIIAILGVGVLKKGFPDKNPFVPSEEEKSAIDMAEQMKDVLEEKSAETTQVSGTTEDEISDWKTYRNEEYGFEVKYPNDPAKYELTKTETNPDYSSWWIKAAKDPSKNSGYKVAMSVYRTSSAESQNVVTSFRNSGQVMTSLQVGIKQLEVQNIPHTGGTTDTGDPEYILWVEPSGKFVVTFSFVYTDKIFREEMLKIIDTFTFK